MYRTNAQSRALEEAFIRAGLPYRLVGAQRFYGRREVKDVIAYLRLIHNPRDDVSFGRIINVPKRAIGRTTQMQIQQYAQINRLPVRPKPSCCWPEMPHCPIRLAGVPSTRSRTSATCSTAGLPCATPCPSANCSTSCWSKPITAATSTMTRRKGQPLGECHRTARVASEADDTSLADFLEQVALVADADLRRPQRADVAHLARGEGTGILIVFITGVEDGILPHSRSLDDMEEMAEERRLFTLDSRDAEIAFAILTRTFQAYPVGNSDVAVPSRFLQDLPADVVKRRRFPSSRQQSQSRMTSWNWSNPDNAPRGRSTHRARASRPTTEYRPRQPLPPSRSAQPERERQSAPIQAGSRRASVSGTGKVWRRDRDRVEADR